MSDDGGVGEARQSIFSKINNYYKYNVFHRIKGFDKIRGTTRLYQELEKLGLRLEGNDAKVNDSDPIYELEWDNLIILDACRYDLYQKVQGEGSHRITLGSGSPEFIRKTFSERNFEDTVCITANPHYASSDLSQRKETFNDLTGKSADDVFYETFMPFTNDEDWDEKIGTVRPEPVVRDALTAERLFPEKRKIIHFMQPHHPFIPANLNEPGFADMFSGSTEDDSIWQKAMKSQVSHEEVVEAYEDNLEYVLDYVFDMIDELEGKTVITADHGNFVGEGGYYGHRRGSDYECIRKVPWHVVKEE